MNSNSISHRKPRQWLKITATAPFNEAENIAGRLASLTGNGVEFLQTAGDQSDQTIVGYLEVTENFSEKRNELESFFKSLKAPESKSVNYSYIQEEDWGEKWKKNFKPFHATKRIVIKPSWDNYSSSSQDIIIEIDPGMAFGTGHHASTFLALELVDSYFSDNLKKEQNILDVGTGTGVLGIACSLLGKSKIMAIDNDPDATAVAKINVKANKVENYMTVSDISLNELGGTYDLVIANIVYGTLMELAPQLKRLVTIGGQLILSGILKGEQAENILKEFGNYDFKIQKSVAQEEWQAFRLKRVK